MLVKQVMARRLATVAVDDTLADAVSLMRERSCGFLPVLADEALVGVVTDRDAAFAALNHQVALGEIRVRDAMKTQVVSCRPEDDIAQVHFLMRRALVRRLPVLDNGTLVGIISLADLARVAMEAEDDGAQARQRVGETLGQVCRPTPWMPAHNTASE